MVSHLSCIYNREPRELSSLHQVPKVVGACSGVFTHHEGIGKAQSHQASTQLSVQRVGDGGHCSDEDHTRPDIFLQIWGAGLVLRVWNNSAHPSGLRAVQRAALLIINLNPASHEDTHMHTHTGRQRWELQKQRV